MLRNTHDNSPFSWVVTSVWPGNSIIVADLEALAETTVPGRLQLEKYKACSRSRKTIQTSRTA